MTAYPPDDEAAIRDLIAGYALALDAGDVDGCVRLFAPTANSWRTAGLSRAMTGSPTCSAPRRAACI